jgi:hypothetical protein
MLNFRWRVGETEFNPEIAEECKAVLLKCHPFGVLSINCALLL